MSPEAWAFLGVVMIQAVTLVVVLINRGQHKTTGKKLDSIERHVNNVEEDIDHTEANGDEPSLGQRLKRMEEAMRTSFEENDRIHQLLAKGLVSSAEDVFKRSTYLHDDVGAYILHKGGPLGWEVVWVSPGYTTLSGMNLKEVRQGDYAERIHPDDYDRVMSTFQTSLAAQVSWEVTYRQRGPEGWHTIHQQAEPYFSVEGELLGQFGLFRVVDSPATHEGNTP